MITVYAAARALTPDGQVAPARVEVEAGAITSVVSDRGPDPRRNVEVVDLGEVTIVPGFIDLHAHGGGGAAFTDGPDAAAEVTATHLVHGTTTMVASLVTDTIDRLAGQVRALRPLVEAGALAGVHLEGPWLSDRHRGAHDPRLLRDPHPADIDRLLDAGGGSIVMATLAVERQGGTAAVERLIGGGATVALGHSDATYDQAHRAVDAGARVATHLFNAARPIGHREPGLIVALLERDEVTIELIADGVHLHPAVVRDVSRLAGHRVALVTDAIAAAGAEAGDYRLGPMHVRVHDRVARVVDADGSSGVIAGSTLTSDRELRFAVQVAGLPLADAVHALTLAPARVLRRPDLGRLAAGCRADLVGLNEQLEIAAVVRGGVRRG